MRQLVYIFLGLGSTGCILRSKPATKLKSTGPQVLVWQDIDAAYRNRFERLTDLIRASRNGDKSSFSDSEIGEVCKGVPPIPSCPPPGSPPPVGEDRWSDCAAKTDRPKDNYAMSKSSQSIEENNSVRISMYWSNGHKVGIPNIASVNSKWEKTASNDRVFKVIEGMQVTTTTKNPIDETTDGYINYSDEQPVIYQCSYFTTMAASSMHQKEIETSTGFEADIKGFWTFKTGSDQSSVTGSGSATTFEKFWIGGLHYVREKITTNDLLTRCWQEISEPLRVCRNLSLVRAAKHNMVLSTQSIKDLLDTQVTQTMVNNLEKEITSVKEMIDGGYEPVIHEDSNYFIDSVKIELGANKTPEFIRGRIGTVGGIDVAIIPEAPPSGSNFECNFKEGDPGAPKFSYSPAFSRNVKGHQAVIEAVKKGCGYLYYAVLEPIAKDSQTESDYQIAIKNIPKKK